MSVCPYVTEFCDSLTGALVRPILTGSVSFDPSRCPPGHRKVSFDLVKYTKSYLRKTVKPQIRKFYNRVVFATKSVK